MSAKWSDVAARRLGAALALGGALALAVAETLPVYEVAVGPLEVVRRSATGGENHGYALALVALAAAAMTLLALRGGGGGAAAFALVALGAAALVIALAIDLPDTRGSGRLPESLAYENARARAGPALALEIAGGALLVGAGLVLLGAGRSARAARARGAPSAGE